MALAITVDGKLRCRNGFILFGTFALSGTYPTGGEPADLASHGMFSISKQPRKILAVGKAGFVYQYDKANKKLLVFSNTAGGANAPLGEHTAATYAAGVSGDTIEFIAIFSS